MIETILQNVRKGSFFRKKSSIDARLFVRDHYDFESKKYAYHPYDDYNKEYFTLGSHIVYVDDYESLYNVRLSYYIN